MQLDADFRQVRDNNNAALALGFDDALNNDAHAALFDYDDDDRMQLVDFGGEINKEQRQ